MIIILTIFTAGMFLALFIPFLMTIPASIKNYKLNKELSPIYKSQIMFDHCEKCGKPLVPLPHYSYEGIGIIDRKYIEQTRKCNGCGHEHKVVTSVS